GGGGWGGGGGGWVAGTVGGRGGGRGGRGGRPPPLASSPSSVTASCSRFSVPVGGCASNETYDVVLSASKPYHSTEKSQPTCGSFAFICLSMSTPSILTVPLLPGAAMAADIWPPTSSPVATVSRASLRIVRCMEPSLSTRRRDGGERRASPERNLAPRWGRAHRSFEPGPPP